jgi:ankyrin repeat protein
VGNELLRRTRGFLTALPRANRSPSLSEALDFQLEALQRAEPEVVAALPTKGGDARHVLAREHYFADWNEARGCDRVIDWRFEAAADAIVDGDLSALRPLLAADPTLARARSSYGHRATLLHHVAANGIEVSRQWQSPQNAPDLARALLEAGAEVDATATMYGSDTTLTLLVSSCHPADAGVQAALVDVLADAGADLDRDGGAPLWTAIVWGYPAAVDRLVARGAPVDNLVFAAAANDLDRVRALVAAPPAPLRFGALPLDPARALEYATIYAAGLGRRDAVALLLQHGPDLGFREPVYGNTAADAASYPHPSAGRPQGSPDVLALLVKASS